MTEPLLWSDAPDIDAGEQLYKSLAAVKGKILRLERNIEKREDGLKDIHKRNPGARRLEYSELLDALTELQVESVSIEQTIKFYNLRVDMFKALAYRKG